MGMKNLSDEGLIYALRNSVGVSDYAVTIANLAADRIELLATIKEQLVEINERLVHEASLHETIIRMIDTAWDQALQQRDEAEDKLAKAWPRASPAEISNRWRYERNLNGLALAELEKTE